MATKKDVPLVASETIERAHKILASPFFFRYYLKALLNAGLVGEQRNALILLIVIVSRLFDRPLSAIVRGVSSAGKNFLLWVVLQFLPARSKKEIDSSSARAWNYAGQSFEHVVVYLRERNKVSGSVHPMRTLISEGELIHQVTEWERGRKVQKSYRVKGPVACVSTTNRELEIDDLTRHISLFVDESPEQTLQIAKSSARDRNELAGSDLKVWQQIHRQIEDRGSIKVALPPWLERVAERVFIGDTTVRRYFPAFLTACRTVCLIRSFQREDWDERSGTILLEFADVAITAHLFEDVVVESMRAQEDSATDIAEAVRLLSAQMSGMPIGADELARDLKVSYQAASNKLRKAVQAGTIRQTNKPEKNNRKLFLPNSRPRFLPDPEELFQELTELGEKVRFVHPLTGEWITYTRNTAKA